MKTEEMKKMLVKRCTKIPCIKCGLSDDCPMPWRRSPATTSKKIRKAFHIAFPDYFKPKNENQKNESIVIWVEKNEVYAKRLSTGESGVAKCSPKDEFNLLTGINLAVARMLGADKSNCSKCENSGGMSCFYCCRACWEDNFKEKK